MASKDQPSYSLSESLTLGQTVEYKHHYAPELLQGVPRALSRDKVNISTPLPFSGVDIWNGYEVSWLNARGKPQVAILRCWVPITSPNLIESKSFKLYLNSFNQSKFADWARVEQVMKDDLSKCAGANIDTQLIPLSEFTSCALASPTGQSLDELDIEVNAYMPDSDLLTTGDIRVNETLYSDLLKSNCLITSQPDWASVMIRYQGQQINHENLLKYLISFRQHNEFHEQCVERIFCDILDKCKPEKLTVYARYTRRGGLDINPFRSNFENPDVDARLPRQ